MSQPIAPTGTDVQIRQAMHDAVDDIGDALLRKHPPTLVTIRAIQGMAQLLRMADLRLRTNALPQVFSETNIVDGEVTNA